MSAFARAAGAPHPGALVALLLAAIFAAALFSLFRAAGALRFGDLANPYLIRILWSSLLQAALSTVLSLASGALIALAVARLRHAALSRALRALLMTMTVLPTIVVVLGVVAVHGGSGFVAAALARFGAHWPPIYGLTGILIAHVAMNAPYAARVFLNALAQVPPEHHRIAAICGLSPFQVFRQCDWPALRRDAPGLAALVMLLCFTSFAVVLSLGGGPRNATLEVAIYEALRIEADFGRAALLSLVQIFIAGAFVLASGRFVSRAPVGGSSGRAAPPADAGRLRLVDSAILVAATAFLAPIPLSAFAGAGALASLFDADVARALLTSFFVAIPAALLSVALAILIGAAAARRSEARRYSPISFVPLLALAMPSFALIAGLYVPLRRFGDNAALAFVLVPFVNALMALPFAFRLIEPALSLSRLRYGRLAAHLSLDGYARLRIVAWPLLRRPLIAAFTMALALSLGDFGVAALFGGPDFRTLPLLLYERMGAYRIAEAQAVALLMLVLSFLLALATERFADAAHR